MPNEGYAFGQGYDAESPNYQILLLYIIKYLVEHPEINPGEFLTLKNILSEIIPMTKRKFIIKESGNSEKKFGFDIIYWPLCFSKIIKKKDILEVIQTRVIYI